MKIAEYKQMMEYLTRPGFNGGGSVRNKIILPKKKPEEEVKKRKIKNFEKAKPALENPKEVKEMIDKPKRGLVDEPGSYAGKPKGYKISAKEQKNINAWNQRFKEAIKAGAVKPYEEQTSMVKYKIKQGQSVGFPKKPIGKFEIPLTNKQGTFYTDSYEDLGVNKKSLKNINAWEKSTGLKWYAQDKAMKKRIVRQGANIRKMSDISAEKKLKDEALEKKRIEKAKNLKIRNDKILKIINNNPGLNASQIAKRAKVDYETVTNLTNSLGIDLQKKADQLLPELKALDKLIKKNTKFLSGDASIADKRRFLFAEMQKQFGPNYTVGEFTRRVQTVGNRYVGQLDQIDAYKGIKGPKNYIGSALHKNIIGLAKSDFLGVVAEARLLGLPQNQIQLLDDVLGGASKLTKMRVAGDHTDINALMKDFPNYKKNFTRINVISNRLNTEKAIADNQLIKLVRQLNNKEITPQEFTTQVEEIRTNFTNKTKVKIGNPVTDARGNVSLDFQTDRLIDLKNPRNKAITQAVTNLIEQEGVKFSDFDVQYSQANTIKDRLNLLKNATAETLKKSKIIKGFAEMSGDVGQAAKNILKTKPGKIGAAGLLYTLATAARPKPTETDLIDEVALTGKTGPGKGLAGAFGAAITAGTQKGRDIAKKLTSGAFKGFGKAFLPLGTPTGTYGFAKNLFVDPTLESIKKGEKIKSSPLQNFAIDVSLPISAVAPTAQAMNLFGPSTGGFFKRTAKDIAKTALGGGYATRGLDALSRMVGLQSKRLGPGIVSRFVPNLFRAATVPSIYAAPLVETAIQGYNAYKDLQEARKKYGMDDTVTTALGQAPRKYVQELISELPEVDRSGAAGGGIMKMAGKPSGPPPEAGPTPQGLDFLMKRGR